MIGRGKKQGPPIRENIHNQLIEDIIQGRINAGERLSEAALGERFGVSKSPIREALLLMERGGYISLKKNVGAVVLKISEKIVAEIYTIIAVLESYAVETVVVEKRIQKNDINRLSKLIRMMEECSKNKKYMDFRPLNMEFHGFDLRKRMYTPIAAGMTLAIHIDQYIESHKQILEAIKQGDGYKAAALMRNHLMETKDFLVDTLKQSGSPH
jgi:DNA-binding GntR family transcriptional regulator